MIIYLFLLATAVLWLLVILLCPLSVHFGFADNSTLKLIYFVFKFICHQLPERSYFMWGVQMPVCARCFGIYSGMVLGLLVYPFFKKLNNSKIPQLKTITIFVAPILIDAFAQSMGLYTTSNLVRSSTGIWFSIGVIFCLMPLLNNIIKNLNRSKK